MKTFSIAKTYPFEAAHRLMNYDGKCKNIHGHNYEVTIEVTKEKLDKIGFVEDFAKLKEICKKFIDENLDHTTIFCIYDKDWIKVFNKMESKIYIMKDNPTAENIAKLLYNIFKLQLPELLQVTITENENSYATYLG